MKHYGDITKINGGEVPAVDVVTFGAPCQDLSVAGLRHGMRHEALGDEETTRSGLFYEAVRIIKEMRDHDRSTGRAAELVRPRFAIYENVPGALSSNGGKDWQAVIQSLIQVVREEIPDIPVPDRGWPSVGSFCGVGEDGVPFSLAYKQHDAQYWGVPQRRKRLSIVVDYAGFDAPWILFDPQFERTSASGEPYETVRDSGARSESGEVRAQCEGLSGDSEPCGAEGQGASAGIESGAGTAIGINRERCGAVTAVETMPTLQAAAGESGNNKPMVFSLQGGGVTSQNSQGSGIGQDVSFTLNTMDVHGVLAVDVYNQTIDGDITGTVTAAAGGTNTSGPKVLSSAEPIPINTMVGTRDAEETRTTFGVGEPGDPQFTISAAHEHAVFCSQGGARSAVYGIDKAITTGGNCTAGGDCVHEEYAPSLTTDRPHAVAYGVVSKGNGEAFITGERHTSLSTGGGEAGQGYPCVLSFQERAGKPGGGKGILIQNEHVGALSTLNNQAVLAFTQNQRDEVRNLGDKAGSLAAEPGMKQQTYICEQNRVTEPTMIEMTSTKNTIIRDGTSCTLTARMGTGGNQVNAVCCDVGFFDSHDDKCGTLLARQYKDPPIVTETYQEQTGALCASGYNKNGTQEAQNGMYVTGSTVRRLTPDECASLQGFPRWWCNIGEWTDSKGKLHKDADSPKYKAYGNSIAVGYDNDQSGFWCWLARRICAQYERRVTMASLFDGIGGFPLAFGAAGAIPVWASEIEEFPIAVTKIRFPEVEE